VRKSVTLIELIFVIVIIAILSIATFKALSILIIRSYKAKELTRLSLESQVVIEQISTLLRDRIPATTIGYDTQSGEYEYVGDITNSNTYTVAEWYNRAKREFNEGNFTGFADIRESLKQSGYKLVTPLLNMSGEGYNLVFAGSFDMADSDILDYKSAFGWHGGESNNSFDIKFDSTNNIIEITDTVKPKRIYEKYFLADGAYAVARGVDIKQDSECIKKLNISDEDINNTLFLFYDYKPWNGKTFCGDKSGDVDGKAAILMKNVQGFVVEEQDYSLRVIIDINRSIKGSSPIHFSKMKVIF
jgi:Tfp pilus assembly protein PilE